jgi:putative Holliday junction resolvase
MVVGWPLNMDGTEGPQGRLVRSRAQELAQLTGLDVRLWDERLSSFVADQALAGAFTRKGKKARQDAVAAAVILQDFLAAGGPDSAPTPDEIDV